MSVKPRTIARGAYGLSFPDLAGSTALIECPATWPSVRVECVPLDAPAGPTVVGRDRAELRLIGGGQLVLDRLERRASFRTPAPLDESELVHPHLAPVGSLFAQWFGLAPLHAGAFAAGGGCVALLGEKEAGKSTTLAWLAGNGADVVTDDILVVDQGQALAGPRCIDLRDESVSGLDVTRATRSRDGTRLRLPLAGLQSQTPLRAFVHLTWGPAVELTRLRGPERLVRLASHSGQRASRRPEALLELTTLPSWELSRPRRLDVLPEIGARLLALAS